MLPSGGEDQIWNQRIKSFWDAYVQEEISTGALDCRDAAMCTRSSSFLPADQPD